MCHGLCETGSTPFLDTLVQLRGWMAANPDEVVTLFIEDHVDAALIAADVEAAGLLDVVYRTGRRRAVADARRDDPLRQAPCRDARGGRRRRRRRRGSSTASSYTQDTPYTFPTVESFNCDANRGPDDAPLLLLNHWLSGFRSLVTDAQLVNATRRPAAPRRAVRAGERQLPNFVAVNYVAIGDVFEVVDTLNGVA